MQEPEGFSEEHEPKLTLETNYFERQSVSINIYGKELGEINWACPS